MFQAIADPVRRDIIELLSKKAMAVNDVADHFDISRPAISKHLRILNECGLIEFDQQGRERYCQIQPKNLIPAFLWIEKYRGLWEERLDSFENYLMELKEKSKKEE